jgi:hypothetical protein
MKDIDPQGKPICQENKPFKCTCGKGFQFNHELEDHLRVNKPSLHSRDPASRPEKLAKPVFTEDKLSKFLDYLRRREVAGASVRICLLCVYTVVSLLPVCISIFVYFHSLAVVLRSFDCMPRSGCVCADGVCIYVRLCVSVCVCVCVCVCVVCCWAVGGRCVARK